MGSLSTHARDALVGHVVASAYTPAATLYLAMSKANPTAAGTGLSEPGNTYARQAIGFGAAASRKVVQSADVAFPEATESWGTITHWAVMDAETDGNMLAFGAFASGFEVVSGNTTTIGSGQIEVEITSIAAAGFTDYLVHKLLGLMFNNAAFSQPDTYAALASATILESATSITEVTGTGYSRTQLNSAGGASPAWSAVSAGATDNANAISWSVDDGDWTEIQALALMDAASSANVLAYDNGNITNQTPGNGDTVKFDPGTLNVSLS